jgi:hypothetical protein
MKPKINDIVTIIDTDKCFRSYRDMVKHLNVKNWEYGMSPPNDNSRYKIKGMTKHLNKTTHPNITVVYVEDIKTRDSYLINRDNLKVVIKNDFIKEDEFTI